MPIIEYKVKGSNDVIQSLQKQVTAIQKFMEELAKANGVTETLSEKFRAFTLEMDKMGVGMKEATRYFKQQERGYNSIIKELNRYIPLVEQLRKKNEDYNAILASSNHRLKELSAAMRNSTADYEILNAEYTAVSKTAKLAADAIAKQNAEILKITGTTKQWIEAERQILTTEQNALQFAAQYIPKLAQQRKEYEQITQSIRTFQAEIRNSVNGFTQQGVSVDALKEKITQLTARLNPLKMELYNSSLKKTTDHTGELSNVITSGKGLFTSFLSGFGISMSASWGIQTIIGEIQATIQEIQRLRNVAEGQGRTRQQLRVALAGEDWGGKNAEENYQLQEQFIREVEGIGSDNGIKPETIRRVYMRAYSAKGGGSREDVKYLVEAFAPTHGQDEQDYQAMVEAALIMRKFDQKTPIDKFAAKTHGILSIGKAFDRVISNDKSTELIANFSVQMEAAGVKTEDAVEEAAKFEALLTQVFNDSTGQTTQTQGAVILSRFVEPVKGFIARQGNRDAKFYQGIADIAQRNLKKVLDQKENANLSDEDMEDLNAEEKDLREQIALYNSVAKSPEKVKEFNDKANALYGKTPIQMLKLIWKDKDLAMLLNYYNVRERTGLNRGYSRFAAMQRLMYANETPMGGFVMGKDEQGNDVVENMRPSDFIERMETALENPYESYERTVRGNKSDPFVQTSESEAMGQAMDNLYAQDTTKEGAYDKHYKRLQELLWRNRMYPESLMLKATDWKWNSDPLKLFTDAYALYQARETSPIAKNQLKIYLKGLMKEPLTDFSNVFDKEGKWIQEVNKMLNGFDAKPNIGLQYNIQDILGTLKKVNPNDVNIGAQGVNINAPLVNINGIPIDPANPPVVQPEPEVNPTKRSRPAGHQILKKREEADRKEVGMQLDDQQSAILTAYLDNLQKQMQPIIDGFNKVIPIVEKIQQNEIERQRLLASRRIAPSTYRT
ncbi:hypothetical protein FACS1894170_10110 [Planctomycetales bacterium]|nr:hypothetical protein FACS1894170_10110 [Planctomycetales bacterium]